MLLAAASVVVAVRGLQFKTSRLDLLNPASRYNQRWLAYLEAFGDEDDAVVVVEGSPAAVPAAIEDIASSLSHHGDLFSSTLYKHRFAPIRRKALHYLSEQQLRGLESTLGHLAGSFQRDPAAWQLLPQLQQLNGRLQKAGPSGTRATQTKAELTALLQSLATALGSGGNQPMYHSPLPAGFLADAQPPFDGDPYLRSPDGKLGLMLVRLAPLKHQSFAPDTESIERLRELIRAAQTRHPLVRIGLTGMPVLENDEMRASQNDTIKASLLSLFAVAVLFIAGFGGWRYPITTVFALLLAMAWSFGYITLAVGHLNILSVSFGVVLIGLGIDFGIHFVARYLQLRETISDSDTALAETAASVGPGIVTGGCTSALAFYTATLTHFTGIAELGVIAGGGILLCIAAALLLLPAMIQIMDRRRSTKDATPNLPLAALSAPSIRFPRISLLASLLLTALTLPGLFRLRYDHNLLNLQPANLESAGLERRLTSDSDQSVWYAVSFTRDAEQLRRRKQRIEKLPSVERTEDIVSLLPTPSPEKRRLIAAIGMHCADISGKTPAISMLGRVELEQLKVELHRSEQLLTAGSSLSAQTVAELQEARRLLASAETGEVLKRVETFQQQYTRDVLQRVTFVRSMADVQAPRLEDLPEELVDRFVGGGRHLLKIYARGSIWDMENLERFVKEIETVDPLVTGHPVQTYYASRQMQRSYLHAATYSLLAVAIVLMLDFRSIRLSLLAMLPMGLGMLQLFGVLGLLGIPLNPANMIVLPLILGIGIDDGVHVLHDFRRQSAPYRLGNATATAVLVTSATTMVGFGSMMLAQHQGLRSLGQVLTLGVLCCLITSLMVLPALLSWFSPQPSVQAELARRLSVEPRFIRPRRAGRRAAASAEPRQPTSQQT